MLLILRRGSALRAFWFKTNDNFPTVARPAEQDGSWEGFNPAWFLHDPSLALRSDGSAIVAYAARDISGGVSTTDPTKPRCVAGTDMILGRIAFR